MTRALNICQMMMLAEYASTEEVREKAGTKAITLAVANSYYDTLIDFVDNERLSEAIRNKAAQSIDETAREAIKKYVANGYYCIGVESIARDSRLSDAIRKEAGTEVIKHYIAANNLDGLIRFARDSRLSDTIREEAGTEVIKHYIARSEKYGELIDLDWFIRFAYDSRLSEAMKEKAGIEIIKQCIANNEKDGKRIYLNDFIQFAYDSRLSDTIREEAGTEIIRHCIATNNFGGLIRFAYDLRLSDAIREKAVQSIDTAGTEVIKHCVVSGDYYTLIDLAPDSRFSKATRKKAAQSIDKAATNLIKRYSPNGFGFFYYDVEYGPGWYSVFADIAGDSRISKATRKKAAQSIDEAATRLVETKFGLSNGLYDNSWHKKSYIYHMCTKLASDERLSEAIRKKAVQSIDEVGRKAIEENIADGGYNYLIHLAGDEHVPEAIRKKAAQSIDEAARKAIKIRIRMGHYDNFNGIYIEHDPDYNNINKIAGDSRLSDTIREEAGTEEIKHYIAANNLDGLIHLAGDEHVPEAIRKKAAQSIDEVATELIQRNIASEFYYEINNLSNNEHLSEAIRKKAAQNIDEAATKIIKFYYIGEDDCYLLTDFASNKRLSDEVRKIFEQTIRSYCTTLERRL